MSVKLFVNCLNSNAIRQLDLYNSHSMAKFFGSLAILSTIKLSEVRTVYTNSALP